MLFAMEFLRLFFNISYSFEKFDAVDIPGSFQKQYNSTWRLIEFLSSLISLIALKYNIVPTTTGKGLVYALLSVEQLLIPKYSLEQLKLSKPAEQSLMVQTMIQRTSETVIF